MRLAATLLHLVPKRVSAARESSVPQPAKGVGGPAMAEQGLSGGVAWGAAVGRHEARPGGGG
jgi:hypothetical protein